MGGKSIGLSLVDNAEGSAVRLPAVPADYDCEPGEVWAGPTEEYVLTRDGSSWVLVHKPSN